MQREILNQLGMDADYACSRLNRMGAYRTYVLLRIIKQLVKSNKDYFYVENYIVSHHFPHFYLYYVPLLSIISLFFCLQLHFIYCITPTIIQHLFVYYYSYFSFFSFFSSSFIYLLGTVLS